MIRLALLYGLALSLGFGLVSWACYATTGGPDPTLYPMPNDNVSPFAGEAKALDGGAR